MAWMAGGFSEEIERIKQEVSIKELVESYGVKLEKKGKDLVGLCPMHNDRSPSLVLTPDKNLWHCLGACQTGGSVIDWVMKREGVSLRHAVEILKEMYCRSENSKGSIKKAVAPKPIKKSTIIKLDSPFDRLLESRELLIQVVEFYHETLKQSKTGFDYLEKRKLNNREMIDHFKLGMANRTLCYRLPVKNRKSGAELRSHLQELGILRESGHEHFRGSLVIPIFGEKGDVVEMYGRKLRDDLRPGTAYHLYLPGPHRGVWNISSLTTGKEIILCESLIDALTFWNYGFRNVTSSYGINGFTKDHMEAFKRYGTERVLIAYDHDEAGDSGAAKVSQQLMAEGIECFRVKLPLGYDVNQYVQEYSGKDVEKVLKQLVYNGEWMGKGNKPVKAVPFDPEKEPEKEMAALSIFPPEPRCDIPVKIKPGSVVIALENRNWRIRGLEKNMSYEILRVNIRVCIKENFYLDTLDLYSAKQRAVYIKHAAAELAVGDELIKKDLGRVLLKLEELQDDQIKKVLEPDNKRKGVVLSETEKKEALDLLKDPKLLDRILVDFKTCGVVGEETNKLVGYLASVSRKLDRPLAILIQSSSAAGKTWLMESVLSFVPEEERIKYSAMTGQSLFYMGESNIKHKILAIVEEEGANRTSYALKLLQSEGELSIASTGKDPVTGQLTTKEYRVEGPVMIFSTTTNIDIDEELQNRCIILTVDESREQTKAIHQMQRERRTLEGIRARKEKEKLLKLHRNAQRLLRPLSILNPYAKRLTFLDDKTRTRRDHEKYLCLIDAIAFLNQYQRSIKSTGYGDNGRPDRYVIVSLDDIELANRLADDVLGRTLDELPPQTRRLLMLIEEMVIKNCKKLKIERSDYRFTRRQVREYCGWGNTQLKVHFKRLEDMEYLIIHRGKRGLTFEYELLYDGKGKDGKSFLMGLINVDKLRCRVSELEPEPKSVLAAKDKKELIHEYDVNKSGSMERKSGPSRPQVGPKSGGCRVSAKPLENKVLPIFLQESEKNAQRE